MTDERRIRNLSLLLFRFGSDDVEGLKIRVSMVTDMGGVASWFIRRRERGEYVRVGHPRI